KFFMKDYALIEPTLAAVRKAFWYHFRRNGIEIPFPIRNVYLHQPRELKTVREEDLQRLSDSLRGVYVFASLADDELRLIAEQLEEMHFAKDEVIIREGETGDSLFVIEEGEVEVFLTSLRGNRKSLGTLRAGDFFGEMALLMGGKRSASVEATMDVCLYKLDKDRFKEILAQKPKILDEISDVLSRRKDQLEDLLAQSSGPHSKTIALDAHEAQTRILSRIRNYFGL
ncbi:MAG TPA: cyclic nucleotide-binding domain-containing protein, partial [Acidobacteriota bacterium]